MGLLDRAKKMMQGRPSPPPSRTQYYSVACAEGHLLQGQRTDGYQALRCPTCGEGIFVLPSSPLPEPVTPASAGAAKAGATARASGFSARDDLVLADPPSAAEAARARADLAGRGKAAPETEEEPEAEIEWDDEAEAAAKPQAPPRYSPDMSLDDVAPTRAPAPPTARTSTSTSANARTEPRAKPAPVVAKAKAPAPKPEPVPAGMIRVEEDERPGPREWAWRNRNALIGAAVAVAVLGTVGVRLRMGQIEDSPRVAELGRVEGLSKLDEGEFDVAKKLLGDASRAVDALGGKFEGADAIRQGAREAAIFADMVGIEDLGLLIEKAATMAEADFAFQFDALYKGRSIVVDAALLAVPDPADPGTGYEVDFQILGGGNSKASRKQGRLDFRGFELFRGASPRKGDRVVLGARLGSVRLDPKEGLWRVGLAADSGVFITHDKALAAALGWPSALPDEADAP